MKREGSLPSKHVKIMWFERIKKKNNKRIIFLKSVNKDIYNGGQ